MTVLDDIRLARVALGCLVEPGNRALWASVATHGPVRVLDGLLTGDAALAVREAAGARLGTADPRDLARAALRHGSRLGARLVVPEDPEWPRQLDHLAGICAATGDQMERDLAPPLCLWVRGPWRLDQVLDRSVAVVGSRAATSYGEYVARQLGYGLGEREWTVISGGAFGIDAHAHRGALAAGGVTVAVLACGIDRPYPAAHANLFDRIAEQGLLVSEWPPGAEPFRHRFLIRNRVIAAAARGTAVVEASARSGALQTLRRAQQLGRVTMAMPGPVTSAMSVGCHEWLRREGVRLVTGVSQVLEEVGRVGADLAPVPRGPEHARDHLDLIERRLVEALLRRKALPAETVAVRAGVPERAAVRTLPSLVARGFAQRRATGFVLAAPAAPAPATSDGAHGPGTHDGVPAAPDPARESLARASASDSVPKRGAAAVDTGAPDTVDQAGAPGTPERPPQAATGGGAAA